MCTITNYRFIISALGSAYINDYEKYTKEAFSVKLYIFIHNEVRDFDKNSTQPSSRQWESTVYKKKTKKQGPKVLFNSIFYWKESMSKAWSNSSAEWLSRVIQDCHYHISSLNSLPVLYIFLKLIVFFFIFFFLFRIAIQWHNLEIVEVGHYLVELEVLL
jgi:hypothetical protein